MQGDAPPFAMDSAADTVLCSHFLLRMQATAQHGQET